MRRLLLAAALLLLGAGGAEAHIVSSRLGDFYAGAIHPMTALQDLVLWLALGLLAGSQPVSVSRWLVALFPTGLAVGLWLGVRWGVPDGPPWLDAMLMVLLGAMTAAAIRVPTPVLLVVAAVVALARGAANAGGVAPGTDVALFAAGFAVAGYAFITLSMAAVEAFRASGGGWRGVAIRAGGSWIAAIGLMVGGLALA